MIRFYAFLCLILIGFWPDLTAAHTRSQSFSTWEMTREGASFSFAVDSRRVTQIAQLYPEETNLTAILARHLRDTVRASQNGEACELLGLSPSANYRETVRLSGHVTCPANTADAPVSISIDSFFAVSPTHIHMARVLGSDAVHDHVLREGASIFKLADTPRIQTWGEFITVGFEHVLSGLDHILFLLALALVARTLRQAVMCITGFTFGHMVSIGLVSGGWVSPDMSIIEAMIGFTMAIMAIEAAALSGLNRRRAMLVTAALAVAVGLLPIASGFLLPCVLLGIFAASSAMIPGEISRSWLPVLTIIFGVIHGAGFASGFMELDLVSDNLWKPLLGFNLGVEIAQIGWLILIYHVMMVLRTYVPRRVRVVSLTLSLYVFVMGVFWFAERLWA